MSEPILVIGPSWVGDMVMAQSLYITLKENSEAALDVVAPSWSLPLLSRMPQVREGIELPVTHGELGWNARRDLGRAPGDPPRHPGRRPADPLPPQPEGRPRRETDTRPPSSLSGFCPWCWRSWRASRSSGIRIASAPATAVPIGYMANDGSANTAEVPGPPMARAMHPSISDLPAPTQK